MMDGMVYFKKGHNSFQKHVKLIKYKSEGAWGSIIYKGKSVFFCFFFFVFICSLPLSVVFADDDEDEMGLF